MKTTLFSTVSALALTGLCLTLTPTTLSAHDGGQGAHHTNGKTAVKATPKGSSRGSSSRGTSNRGSSNRGSHGRTCKSLPKGCHASNYHGHSCWYGGGHYWGVCADGSYQIIDDQAEIDTTIVDAPVVDTTVETTVVDQAVVTDDDAVTVSVLPDDAEVTYIGGEKCWYSNGCYYHRSGHGYSKTHCKDKGGRVCKTGKGGKGSSMSNRNRGARCKAPTSKGNRSNRSTLHSSSHSSGHSSGHGHK